MGKQFKAYFKADKYNFQLRPTQLYTPLCRSIGRLVGRSPFYFFGVFERFEPSALAQPQATGVAVYPALFFYGPRFALFIHDPSFPQLAHA